MNTEGLQYPADVKVDAFMQRKLEGLKVLNE